MNHRRQIQMPFGFRRAVHGGESSRGHQKRARPIATKKAMHLVLKSSIAIGAMSLHRQGRWIESLVKKVSRQFGVRLFQFSNNGNHIHLVVMASTRDGYKAFVRTFSGTIAQKMTGSRKLKAQGYKFWDHIPFSRILEWGKDFETATNYVVQNFLEDAGLIPYTPRKTRASPV